MFLSEYFSGALRELHNVTWPTRRQAVVSALLVLVFVLVCSALVGAWDWLLSLLLNYFL